jgi:hypothetical protein
MENIVTVIPIAKTRGNVKYGYNIAIVTRETKNYAPYSNMSSSIY